MNSYTVKVDFGTYVQEFSTKYKDHMEGIVNLARMAKRPFRAFENGHLIEKVDGYWIDDINEDEIENGYILIPIFAEDTGEWIGERKEYI